MIARSIPTSPAMTPRRAEPGELIHLRERMKSAVATRYEASIARSRGFMPLLTLGLSRLEHPEHPVRDEEAADDVARRRDDRDRREDRREGRAALAGEEDRADDGDRVQGVRQGHEGRVEERRDPPYHLESDEGGQHEDVEAVEEVDLHSRTPSFPSGRAARPRNSRTRGFTISPPLVRSVSLTIGSFQSGPFASFRRWRMNAVRFRAYIWLA